MNPAIGVFFISSNNFLLISLAIFSIMMSAMAAYCLLPLKTLTKNYKKQIALLEAQSLQSQINPHFIFNILNGLQNALILKSGKQISQYISGLSKLMRMTLEFSKKEIISLKEEIKYLESYLDLQRLRLDEKLEYCIDLSQDIDPANTFLPPLLVQPLVENAIVHGIVPSKTKGILVIGVKQSQDSMVISVMDNGIGLEESQKIKKKYKYPHQSMGNKLIKERLEILNYRRKEKISFFLGKLIRQGVGSGTHAGLKIPTSLLNRLKSKSPKKVITHEED